MSSSGEQASSGSSSSGERGGAEQVIRILAGLTSLLYSLWVIWYLIPEHQKRLMLMRLSRAIQNSARSAACRAAGPAMRQELRSGVPNYVLPLSLMRLADRAARAYDRWRYTE